ncbi:MAG TPA: M1 family aminopeptidase [Terriglobales bacterium]|nr:M1 family aminopeptidase [Terriglobales bacterium]
MPRVVKVASLAFLFCGIAILSRSQEATPTPIAQTEVTPGPAETTYLKLRSVGLDKTHVYKIREASLDRAKLHISLDDGTIAFTEAVDGHITGAFFVGYGEVLVIPPNEMERQSLSLFTGTAILEETFSSAYLRFNDDVFSELQPYLRQAENPEEFASQWSMTASNIAPYDALRLLFSFSDSLPAASSGGASGNDHMLHAYVEGNKLGGFDLRYDSLLEEQIEVGQHKRANGEDYYNVWTSFAVPVLTTAGESSTLRDEDETPNAELDVTHFKIQTHITPPKEMNARAELSITALQRTHRALLFELSRMLRVNQVQADGKPVEFIHNQAIEGSHLAKQGNDVIAVILPAALEKGQRTELTFQYSGSVLSEAANGLLYVGDRGTWYPNVGFAMSSFDLEFSYPVGWTLVATGERKDLKAGEAEQTSRWTTTRPVPIAGFNLGKYSQTASHAGKILVMTYATPNVERGFAGTATQSQLPLAPNPRRLGLPAGLQTSPVIPDPARPSPSNNAQMVGAASARAIEFYEHYFGPYPYGTLAITQMPGTISQGWPGLIFLSSYAFLTPEERSNVQSDPVRRLMWEQTVAHETAHQWWGDLVNWSGYRDQWIMEALANYSAMMLLESHDPLKFQMIMQGYRDDLMAKNDKGEAVMNAGPVALGYRLSSSEFPGAYEPICYGRGTWLLHMLRAMMNDGEAKGGTRPGEEPFVRALRKLRREYEDKSVSTSQLLHVFETELPEPLWYEGHKSLDWFYEGWVNGSAIPSYELRDLKFSERGKTTVVSGTIVQDDAPDKLVTPVPIYAVVNAKSVFVKRIFAEGKETAFRITVPTGTRKLLIDPEKTLLSRSK